MPRRSRRRATRRTPGPGRGDQPTTPSALRVASQEALPLPSKTARASGSAIALVTGLIGIVMIADATGGGLNSVDDWARVVGGALMLGLAVVVGMLSVFPAQIASWVRRR